MGHLLGDYTGPIYSPSQTEVFLSCPMKWWLRYNLKYIPTTYSEKELAGCVGTAFSTYQEHIDEPDAEDIAMADLTDNIRKLAETRECIPRALAYEATAPDRLRKYIKLFNEHNPIPKSWRIYDRERAYPNWGNSRIDFAYETSMGDLGVGDFKTRGRLQANQVDKAKREFATRGQMFHYIAMASDETGKDINQFSIVLATLEPRHEIFLWQYRVKPRTLEVWLAGRKQVWQMMTAMKNEELTPWMAEEHADKFGKCQYADVCFKHGFDEQAILEDFQVR